MNAIMKSVSPIECERIASGEQSILICKTRPKIDTSFKVYIYRTIKNVYEIVEEYDSNFKLLRRKKTLKKFSGEVIGEFICDEIIEIGNYQEVDHSYMLWVKDVETTEKLCKNACMSEFEIQDYLGKNGGYGWHISDLKIYDEPKELGEFFVKGECPEENCSFCKNFHRGRGWLNGDTYDEDDCIVYGIKPITRPPVSWCYVEEL